MEWLLDVGLGLDHHALRLDRTDERWIVAGERLRDDISVTLVGLVAGVEQIGSSSVIGLLAKPIIDIAVGITTEGDLHPLRERLETAGWIYRGDAGANGGHVFVLEATPHVVRSATGLPGSRKPQRNRPRSRNGTIQPQIVLAWVRDAGEGRAGVGWGRRSGRWGG